MNEQHKPKSPQNNDYSREIRCPIHNRLIGRYDARHGVTNVTFFCPKCGQEYTFTRKAEKD